MSAERAQVEIQAAMDESTAAGAEVGLQVAVIRNGRVVVDAAGGVADPGTGAAASFLLGEILRRTTGRTMSTLLRAVAFSGMDEVMGPRPHGRSATAPAVPAASPWP